jgi:CRISPR locus-related DNA-binding protein
LGGKLQDQVHPIFIVSRIYPAKFFHLILSNEPPGRDTKSVEQNLNEIKSALNTSGISYNEHYMVLEDFWKNVSQLAEMIVATEPEDPVILNFSTGRRVFVSAMVIAGSLAKGWVPEKTIICVQTSANYDKAVIFEPNVALIPDNDDRFILNCIQQNERFKTTDIADMLGKSQSTISVRLKKLVEADYIEIKGHSKYLKVKGKFILESMNNLTKKKFSIFHEIESKNPSEKEKKKESVKK